jgi:DNA-binding winged helix-turn-helix (wHTH) protein
MPLTISKLYSFGPFHLDAATQTLFRGAEPLSLGRRAVALLCVLVEQPGIPVSKRALIETAWADRTVEESNLTVQIAALRRALAQAGGARWIETWPRRGYRFVGPAVTRQGCDVMIRSQPAAVLHPATSQS